MGEGVRARAGEVGERASEALKWWATFTYFTHPWTISVVGYLNFTPSSIYWINVAGLKPSIGASR